MSFNEMNFKENFNKILFENKDLMLNLSLRTVKANSYCYIRMQAYTLCEYDGEEIFFKESIEKERIKIFFNEVMYKSYSIRLPDDYFSNERLTDLTSKFDFINNLPEDYLLLYQKHQKKIFENYYENISEEKNIIFNFFSRKYKKKLKGIEYAELLNKFLTNEYELVNDGYFVKLERKINDNLCFFIKIDTNFLDIEFTKYKRSPPSSAFLYGGFYFFGREFVFNRIEHPLIHSVVFYNDFIRICNFYKDMETAFKWFFIQIDITAYFIDLCFEFYEECFNIFLMDSKIKF